VIPARLRGDLRLHHISSSTEAARSWPIGQPRQPSHTASTTHTHHIVEIQRIPKQVARFSLRSGAVPLAPMAFLSIGVFRQVTLVTRISRGGESLDVFDGAMPAGNSEYQHELLDDWSSLDCHCSHERTSPPELPHSIQCDDWQPHPSSELVNVSELRHRLAPFPSLLSADFPLFCKFASFHLSHPTSLSGRNAFFASPKHTNRYVGPAQLASPDVQRALCTPWRTFQQPLLRRAGTSPYRTPTAGHALYQ
jgi:hypothetical protein